MPSNPYVYSYVPEVAVDSILKDGLYGGKALLSAPDKLALMAKSRGSTVEQETKGINKALSGWHPHQVEGPNVMFAPPPDIKSLAPAHPLKTRNLALLRIHLANYLKDNPNTRVHGMELVPYNSKGDDLKGKALYQFIHRRHHDLSSREIRRYMNTPGAEIWKNYQDPENKGYYAADVPHASVINDVGIIPAKYLEKYDLR